MPEGMWDVAFTYFFRDMETLELIAGEVLPTLRGYRYIRIWDAGCAHGPEAYSIAITLRENMTHFLFRNVRIHATDIDTSGRFGGTITEGIYPEDELKRIPRGLREKYFTATGEPGHYGIDDEIRSRVEFTRHDLLSLKLIRAGFGLVVCRSTNLSCWFE